MKEFVIHDLILDLGLIPLQFLIHALPFLRIAEGNHPIEVVMGQLSRLQLGSLNQVIQGLQRLEKRGEIATLSKKGSTK
jgi:hypothetical protein